MITLYPSGHPPSRRRLAQAVSCSIVLACCLAGNLWAQVEPDRIPFQSASEFKASELGFAVKVPDNWSVEPQKSRNSRTLVNIPAGAMKSPTSFVQVFAEQRLSHQDALDQIKGFATGATAEEKRFVQVDGWPAVQITRHEIQPAPDNAPPLDDPHIVRVYTYIAAGDMLYTVSGRAPSNATAALVQDLVDIGLSLKFAVPGDPSSAREELKSLQSATQAKSSDSSKAEADRDPVRLDIETTPIDITAEMGANDRINTNGFGELEIATSPDGQNVVVALQSRRWVSSNNGGATFPNNGRVGTGNGDPSVAWGQSGKFYMAWIDNSFTCDSGYLNPVVAPDLNPPAGPDPAPDGLDCTGIARSDDNGLTFQSNIVNPAVVCIGRAPDGDPDNPGECFPDQEHIAADRWNPGDTPDDDQVYSTWRNFRPGGQNASLVCSSDSGVTWTAPFEIGADEVFPRITVGPDGFVYVATYRNADYRLYKFTSCVNGLTLVPGFPVTVGNRDPYQCPFAGHDRCDQNPTSQTVVVDETDPNHVYYAYVNDRGNGDSGDSDIIVRDSLNGGQDWNLIGRVARANENVDARRIMPWLCTTGGDAVVTWFEQRGTLPTDTTDFFGARVGLDEGGDLVPMEEFILSEVTDNWCDIGWAGLTRWGNTDTQVSNAAEACPDQPQLAGQCRSDDGDDTNDSQNLCDFSDDDGVTFTNCPQAASSPSGQDEKCMVGGGVPKYGDYNGNACAGGKLFAAWASANAPDGLAPPDTATNPGVLFEVINLDGLAVPVITVPGNVHFEAVCPSDPTLYRELNVCNTGAANLQVDVISSDNPDFEVTVPSSGYPVTISPDFCFPFEVAYTPANGSTEATLTIPSNDPDRPSIEVIADAVPGAAEISTFIANSGNFGEICSGTQSDLNLTINNDGSCDLQIDAVTLFDDDDHFELPDGSFNGTVIEAGNSLQVPVRFSPTNFTDPNPRTAGIEVASRTVGGDTLSPVNTSVSGTVPPPDIGVLIANSGNFGAVCKGGHADLDLTVFNHGKCDLQLQGISLQPDAGSFLLPDGLSLPRPISPDAEYTIPVRYAPEACDDTPEARTIQVDSDDPDQGQIDVPVSGVSPCPNLVIDPAGLTGLHAFPPTVVDVGAALGCFSDRSVVLRNNSVCPLTIDGIGSDVPDFSVVAPTLFPVLLPGGEETLEVTVRFAPLADASPFGPSEVAGILSIVSDDPDFPHTADLCGESSTQSGIRTLVTDVTTGIPIPVDSVDSMTVRSKGKNTPSPINISATDVEPSMTTICGNDVYWHLNLETLPATNTTGGKGGKSQYEAYAKEGNLQDSRTFALDQCEFAEFQLQLQSTDSGGGPGSCPLKAKGESCTSGAECCSGKCTGRKGAQTCN